MFEIINIKFSCRLTQGLDFNHIEEKFPYLSHQAGHGRVVIRCESFTFCMMGRQNRFLNITGLKCFGDVMASINCFENSFESTKILLESVKFDSICAIYSASPKILTAILSSKESQFWIKKYPNILSRINIKPKQPIGGSKGMSANIFKSGKAIIFGSSNLTDIWVFISLMKGCLLDHR